MPRLPVPALKDTVAGYLRSVQPIMSADEYAKVKKDADEFLNSNVARKCQAMLVLKSWLAGNYVSDWCVALNLTFCGRVGGRPRDQTQPLNLAKEESVSLTACLNRHLEQVGKVRVPSVALAYLDQ
jgi:hypothetical protein